MIEGLIKLYKERRELTLLEITYFALAVVLFVIAGTIALFNQALGVSILIAPLIALIAGIANIVVWSLVKINIESLVNKREDDKEDRAKISKTSK